MNTSTIIIRSFDKGMLDRIKQDIPFEQGVMDSVLWLENFNPNIIIGSLVRRGACVHTPLPDDVTEPAHNGVIGRDQHSVNIATFCDTNGASISTDTLYTVNEIFTVAPYDQRVITSAHRHDWAVGKRGTKLISYYGIEEFVDPDTLKRRQWREPHTDNRLYPGMKVYGAMKDWTQYSQVMLFCTYPDKAVLDDDTNALSPVYTYFFEDRRDLGGTTKFFQGITLPTATYQDNQLWKVKERYDLSQFVNIWFSQSNELPTSKTLDFDLDIREAKTIQTLEAGKSVLGNTLEPYIGDSIDDGDKLVYTKQLIADVSFNFEGLPRTVTKVNLPYCEVDGTKLHGTWSASPVGTLLTAQPNFVDIGGFGFRRTFFNAHWVDYRQTRTPRRWCRNEVVPYIITMIVDGIERIIKRDKYYTPSPLPIADETEGYGLISSCYVDGGAKYFPVTKANSCQVPINPNTVYAQAIVTNEPPTIGRYGEIFVNYHPCLVDPYIKFQLLLSNVGSLADLIGKVPTGATEFRLYVSQPSVLESEQNITFNYEFPFNDAIGEQTFLVNNSRILNEISLAPDDLYKWPRVRGTEDTAYCLVKRFLIQGEADTEPDSSISEFSRDVQGLSLVASNNWTTFELTGTTYIANAGASGDPSYYLWDYPLESPSLTSNLGTAIVEWKGKGARLISNIKGRTFLSGTIGEDGKEEQGIIRYSLEQNGVMSTDVFSELSILTLARMPFTALANFREQLWAFGRFELHRIQFPDLLDENTWEVLEKIEGQGTFNPKSVCITPHGVVWLNENGCWFSDGRYPENIAEGILETYKYYVWSSSLFGLQYAPFYTPMQSFAEVTYNNVYDEIIISVPVSEFFKEVRLIYSFSAKNWRAEVQETIALQTNSTHKMRWSSDNLYNARLHGNYLSIAKQYNHGLKQDNFLISGGASIPIAQHFNVQLFTHEVGDGVNDSLMRKIIMEGTPIDVTAIYNAEVAIEPYSNTLTNLKDPQLIFDMRNIVARSISSQPYATYEAVEANVKGTTFWQSPLATPQTGTYQRESYMLNTPFGLRFRRGRFHLHSRNLAHLRSIEISIGTYSRRMYS